MTFLPLVLSLCLATAQATPAEPKTPETTTETQKPSPEKEDAAKQKTPSLSENVVVTATRSQREVNTLPVSVAVVGHEAIKVAPARGVDDLLREIPGVQPSVVSSTGSTPNQTQFSMHGLGGTRALVLLDGIPLHDPYDGIVQWHRVPLQSLGQIEVLRGGSASLYGNFALGGTVNLITSPIDESNILVDLGYGSRATGVGAISIDSVVNPAVSVRLSHYQFNTDGFLRVPDAGPLDVPAWVDNAVTTARGEFQLSDRTKAFLTASASSYDFSQGTPLTYSKRELDDFAGGLHHAVGSSSLISVTAYHRDKTEFLTNSRVSGDRTSEVLTQSGDIDSNGTGTSFEWSTQRAGSVPYVSVGLDLQQLEASEDRTSFDTAGDVTARQRVDGRQRFAGVFTQASWKPMPRMEILGSLRYDWFQNDNGSDVTEGGDIIMYPSKKTDQLDPRVSVRYALTPRSAIRGSVYRAFKAPTLRDLYRSNQTGRSVILGNPDLGPETLVGGEAGWEWANGTTRVELIVFRSEIDGLQARVNVAGQPSNVFTTGNLGTARSQGVEMAADWRISRHWQIKGGYTFVDGIVTSDPDPELIGNQLPEVPRHAGSLVLRYSGDLGTQGEIRARALSRAYGNAANDAIQPAHQVVDFSLSQRLRSGLEAYVLVENIFDEAYWVALTPSALRNGQPRTITAGLRFNGARWKSGK